MNLGVCIIAVASLGMYFAWQSRLLKYDQTDKSVWTLLMEQEMFFQVKTANKIIMLLVLFVALPHSMCKYIHTYFETWY